MEARAAASASACLPLLRRHFLLLLQGGKTTPARQAVQPWSKFSSCLATRQAPPRLQALATAVSTTRSSSLQPSPTSLPSSIARLTMTNVVGIDVAVAQATQTPQQLQKQQAALYGGMGAMYMPTQSGAILDSILASGPPHQQTLRPGQQALERAGRLYRSAALVCEVC